MSHRRTPGAYCERVDERLVPDRERPGAWIVRVAGTAQSYIDPDPAYLEFDYVQRVVDVIDTAWPAGERIAVVHVGGGGLTIPRYIAHTRPTSAQIVLEPDATLTEAVRAVAPLPRHSGIKVRAVDGRTGVAGLRDAVADLVVVDAFAGAQVPAELGTAEWFASVRRVLRPGGVVVMNLTDHAPFPYARRVVAGICTVGTPVVVGTEPSTLRGRRFGNLVASAGAGVDPDVLERRGQMGAYPYHMMSGLELDRWLAGAKPFTDADAVPSPLPGTPWLG